MRISDFEFRLAEVPLDSKQRHFGQTKIRNPKSAFRIRMLFRRCLNVHIDLLCSTTAKQAASVNEQQNQHDDHKDRDDRDYTRTSPTTTAIVVGHDVAPSRLG